MRVSRKLALMSLVFIFMANFGCKKSEEDIIVIQVQETISKIISLLERGEHKEMLEHYLEPEIIRGRKSSGHFNELLVIFSGEPSKKLLTSLRKANKIYPVICKELTEVIFDDETFPQPLRFRNIEGKWYLLNK